MKENKSIFQGINQYEWNLRREILDKHHEFQECWIIRGSGRSQREALGEELGVKAIRFWG